MCGGKGGWVGVAEGQGGRITWQGGMISGCERGGGKNAWLVGGVGWNIEGISLAPQHSLVPVGRGGGLWHHCSACALLTSCHPSTQRNGCTLTSTKKPFATGQETEEDCDTAPQSLRKSAPCDHTSTGAQTPLPFCRRRRRTLTPRAGWTAPSSASQRGLVTTGGEGSDCPVCVRGV